MVIPPTIIHLETVDSTQDEALRRITAGTAQHGMVITADAQTKGRGRQGRPWETPPLGNLAATLMCELPNGSNPGDYSIITAVSMHAAIASFLTHPDRLKIKWPNDLLLNDKKCAGILLEAPVKGWLLIGTGVNIAYAPETRAKISDHVRGMLSPRDLLDRYLTAFFANLTLYQEAPDGFRAICTRWMDHAYGVGQTMTVRTERDEFQAIFEGLDDHGACQARLVDGTLRLIHAGDVFF